LLFLSPAATAGKRFLLFSNISWRHRYQYTEKFLCGFFTPGDRLNDCIAVAGMTEYFGVDPS
jgi:hypothetical protein